MESKIFGPLTLKQFIYLAGGAGVIVLLYSLLPIFIVILLGLPVAAFSSALAFYKVNNQPFIKVVESALKFYTSDKLYLWKKEEEKEKHPTLSKNKGGESEPLYIPKLTKSKLQDLAWSLDISKEIKH